MTVKPVQDLSKGDRFKLGLRDFVVQSISTKRQNVSKIDAEFTDVVLDAESLDGKTEITGFFSEGILVEILDDSDPGMTIEELRSRLVEIKADQNTREANDGWEGDHRKADKALLAFINDPEVSEFYSLIHKWYS